MEKFSSGTQKNVSEDVIEELFEKDYIKRTNGCRNLIII